MPVFTFSGKNTAGEKIAGERVAPNKQVLATQLRREQISAPTIREKGKEFAMPTFGSGKVKTKDIAIFFRQFSVMIDAGLPLVQCLEILAANQESPAFQKCLTNVRMTVEGGATLANAMRQHPKIFDDLTTNMIEAGEAGGILDTILQRLSTYMEKIVKLKAAIKSALIYPVSVLSIAALVVGCLLKFVVPIFPNMVTQMIGVGEATGAMDAMLQKIADFYEDEVDAATKNLLTLMEPAMIAILGVVVGGIVISLYLPMFSMIAKLS